MRIRHETLAAVFNTVYIGLASNLLLAVGCAPLLLMLMLTDPTRTWPLLAVLAPFCAPALVGVFAVLRAFAQEGSTAAFTIFGQAWRASWRRAAALGALAAAALAVLAVDLVWARRVNGGALAVPVLVVLAAVVVATTVLVLVALSERPTVRLRDAVKVCGYLAVRRWYLTLTTLVLLGTGEVLLAVSPLAALGLAAAPLLYLVWANCRYTLRPALDEEPDDRPNIVGTAAARAGRGAAPIAQV